MTRFRIIYAIVFLMLLIFALLAGGTLPYFLLYIFLLAFLIPLTHNLLTYIKIKGSVHLPEEYFFTGDPIDIVLRVKNNSIFPITYLEIKNNISRELTGIDSPSIITSLNKKQLFSKTESILLKRRGFYELGETEVKIKDVFGFFLFKKKISSNTSLLVYPETINLSTFQTNSSEQLGELLVQKSSFIDKTRFDSTREYREGDSVKDIHWKLSAKQEIPLIKLYEHRGDTYINIFIDNESKHYNNDIDRRIEDKAAEAAISIINYCLNQNIEVHLHSQDKHSPIHIKGEQVSDYKLFLEALARFKGNGTSPFGSLLMPRFENITSGSTIVIITPNLDKTMGSYGMHLRAKNLSPLYIALTDKENERGYIDQSISHRLKQERIPIYTLDASLNTKDTLEAYNG